MPTGGKRQQGGDCSYPTDVTDQQWKLIQKLVPRARPGGRPRSTHPRAVLNAIFYLNRTGCAWRYLPRTFPPWRTVYEYFCQWAKQGILERIHNALVALCRHAQGRHKRASVLLLDSQSVKCHFGQARGYDGFKKVRGRKRHILTDTLGLIHGELETPAQFRDHQAGLELLRNSNQRLHIRNEVDELYVDGGYRTMNFICTLFDEFHLMPQYTIANVARKKDANKKENVLIGSSLKPVRWIVERTFAWMNHYRRLARDYERKILHSQNMVFVAMMQLMLNRLHPSSAAKNYWRCH